MSKTWESLHEAHRLWESDTERAQQLLIEVQRDHEGTPEAEIAQAYLHRLKQGGARPDAPGKMRKPDTRNVSESTPEGRPAVINERALLAVRIVASFAFGLWLCSLALPAVFVGGSMRPFPGIFLLAFAWAPPGTLPWSANIFVLRAVFALVRGRSATRDALAAALLSPITFVVRTVPNDAGPAYVEGYGIGALLWFVAIMLVLAAALSITGRDARWRLKTKGTIYVREPYAQRLAFGLVPAVMVAVVFGALALGDHRSPNSEERARLAEVLFQWDPVCSVEQPQILSPLSPSTLPLEVVVQGSQPDLRYPYHDVRGLLRTGIESIRVGDRDYSAVVAADGLMVKAVPAAGAVAATLSASRRTRPDGRNQIHASLVDASGRTIFDHDWTAVGNNRFCPSYSAYSTQFDAQPMRTIMAAFGIDHAPPPQRYPRESPDRVGATVLGAGGNVEPHADRMARWLKDNPERANPNARWQPPRSVSEVQGCPPGVGWLDEPAGSPFDALHSLGWGFATAAGAYYARGVDYHRALCTVDAVYLSRVQASFNNVDGNTAISVQKRSLVDFSQQWSYSTFMNGGIPRGDYEVSSVLETPQDITLELANRTRPTTFRVALHVSQAAGARP